MYHEAMPIEYGKISSNGGLPRKNRETVKHYPFQLLK